ncbi:hypothetical protein POTOM_010936 [Populus tomentosa]|uniref:Rad60/SUMO-like domain-containing protein n=1 Tax=Populus tomentosa TaxID=118781 RepID=A0A8X8DCU3_POPTO|nr:hypothetical protein POTOM_010936 [Populus tomentosa]
MSEVTGQPQEEDQSAHINLKVKGQEKLLMKGHGKDLFTCGATSLYGNIDLVSCLEAVVCERIYATSKMSGTTFSSCLPCDGNEVFFRIKRSTQLKKLMNAYCDRQSVAINSIAFLFDGRRLRREQTPDEGLGIVVNGHICAGLVLLNELSLGALTVTKLS